MGKIDVIVEVRHKQDEAFATFSAALESETESLRLGEDIVSDLAGFGLEVQGDYAPVPMFAESRVFSEKSGFATFATSSENKDIPSETVVVAAEVERSKLQELSSREGIAVFPNSPISLFCCEQSQLQHEERISRLQSPNLHPFDLALSSGGVDCDPHRPAVDIPMIRNLLGVERVWSDGFRGQNVVIGIIDNGVNKLTYPVVGGFTRPNSPSPGSSHVSSHGSMCAADILVSAPFAKLYDYPLLNKATPRTFDSLVMFNEVLNQRRMDGTPHLTNNSYGWMGKPRRDDAPGHEIYDLNHAIHRKIREVVASGCPTLFAAGNCGENCPDGRCHVSGIGPGNSIHGSNSLTEVITVAAINSRHERIGYSSQGPGNFEDGFERAKPDISAYSHFFGNFGPGRPAGGGVSDYDSGTSAATPVATGVAALLMSAFPEMTPVRLKKVLIDGAVNIGVPGWDPNTGFGVINAAASYMLLRNEPR